MRLRLKLNHRRELDARESTYLSCEVALSARYGFFLVVQRSMPLVFVNRQGKCNKAERDVKG
jgi:hypothetical protein